MAKSFLVDINLNKNEIQNVAVQNLATDPSNPIKGLMYFNTTTNRFRVFNGTTWDEMGTGGGTVTSVAAQNATDGGLTVSGSPITGTGTLTIGHSNILLSAQTTQAIYPFKYDKNGHITGVGSAFDPSTKQNTLNTDQINAVNSGITSTKVTTYDNYANEIANKQNTIEDLDEIREGAELGATAVQPESLAAYAPLNSPALTGVPTAPTATAGTNTTQVATTAFVKTAIDNLPEPMLFKGTVGTGGTITWANLPSPAPSNEGWTYKVIENHSSVPVCKVGDTIISNGSEWTVIPSGDEPSGTVTSVNLTNGGGLTISGGPITSSGSITVGHTNTVAAQSTQAVYPITIDANGHIASYGTAAELLKKYSTNITGNGSSTSFTVTHNLGSRDIIIQVYDNITYEEVIVDIYRTTASTATIEFAQAPVSGKTYRVVVIG